MDDSGPSHKRGASTQTATSHTDAVPQLAINARLARPNEVKIRGPRKISEAEPVAAPAPLQDGFGDSHNPSANHIPQESSQVLALDNPDPAYDEKVTPARRSKTTREKPLWLLRVAFLLSLSSSICLILLLSLPSASMLRLVFQTNQAVQQVLNIGPFSYTYLGQTTLHGGNLYANEILQNAVSGTSTSNDVAGDTLSLSQAVHEDGVFSKAVPWMLVIAALVNAVVGSLFFMTLRCSSSLFHMCANSRLASRALSAFAALSWLSSFALITAVIGYCLSAISGLFTCTYQNLTVTLPVRGGLLLFFAASLALAALLFGLMAYEADRVAYQAYTQDMTGEQRKSYTIGTNSQHLMHHTRAHCSESGLLWTAILCIAAVFVLLFLPVLNLQGLDLIKLKVFQTVNLGKRVVMHRRDTSAATTSGFGHPGSLVANGSIYLAKYAGMTGPPLSRSHASFKGSNGSFPYLYNGNLLSDLGLSQYQIQQIGSHNGSHDWSYTGRVLVYVLTYTIGALLLIFAALAAYRPGAKLRDYLSRSIKKSLRPSDSCFLLIFAPLLTIMTLFSFAVIGSFVHSLNLVSRAVNMSPYLVNSAAQTAQAQEMSWLQKVRTIPPPGSLVMQAEVSPEAVSLLMAAPILLSLASTLTTYIAVRSNKQFMQDFWQRIWSNKWVALSALLLLLSEAIDISLLSSVFKNTSIVNINVHNPNADPTQLAAFAIYWAQYCPLNGGGGRWNDCGSEGEFPYLQSNQVTSPLNLTGLSQGQISPFMSKLKSHQSTYISLYNIKMANASLVALCFILALVLPAALRDLFQSRKARDVKSVRWFKWSEERFRSATKICYRLFISIAAIIAVIDLGLSLTTRSLITAAVRQALGSSAHHQKRATQTMSAQQSSGVTASASTPKTYMILTATSTLLVVAACMLAFTQYCNCLETCAGTSNVCGACLRKSSKARDEEAGDEEHPEIGPPREMGLDGRLGGQANQARKIRQRDVPLRDDPSLVHHTAQISTKERPSAKGNSKVPATGRDDQIVNVGSRSPRRSPLSEISQYESGDESASDRPESYSEHADALRKVQEVPESQELDVRRNVRVVQRNDTVKSSKAVPVSS